MEPEEIDKIFKNRLDGLPVPPSADAWMRLQQKMEPPKKERTMWIYYAAASVVILLVSGLLVFRNYNPEPTATVAQTEVNAPAEKNNSKNPIARATTPPETTSTSETAVIAQLEKEAEIVNREPKLITKKETTGKKADIKLAQVKPKGAGKKSGRELPATPAVDTKTDNAPALALENKAVIAPESQSVAANKETNNQVVQVLVKQDNTDEAALAYNADSDPRENISKKGALLKNIYKQARNLKNGEPVELAALGLNTEKINSEKENIKQKLNKVISL